MGNFKRMVLAILTGALLGIFCIAGIGYRIGIEGNELFLLAVWYNRLLMGIVIGIASSFKIMESELNVYFRGFVLGTLISGALFITSGFQDEPSFLAGIVYGITIDYVASKFS